MATQRIAENNSREDFILAQPVSERRRQQFLETYLNERELTRTTEMVFHKAGALKLLPKPAPEGVDDAGFRVTVFKASFVDDENSLLVSEQHFATVQEEFLLDRVEEALRGAVVDRPGQAVRADVPSFLDALDLMAEDIRRQGGIPTLFVLAGQVGQDLYAELKTKLQPPWDWFSNTNAQWHAVHRLIGVHSGVPVLNIAKSPVPTLYAVDLAKFATLTRYGEGEKYLPEFRVDEFSEAEARAILARQPRLILDPPPESGDEDERIRQLRLRVGLELWETYDLQVHDRRAVIGRPIVDAYDE